MNRSGGMGFFRDDYLVRFDYVITHEPGEHKMEHHGTRRLVMIGPKPKNCLPSTSTAPNLADKNEAPEPTK